MFSSIFKKCIDMPYPVSHVLFFVLCISAVAIYAAAEPLIHGKLSFRHLKHFLLVLFVGSLCTLLPDIMIIYNLPVKGTLDHCWIGPIATHSILFSSTAIIFGTLIGYIVYGKFVRAIYLGLFGESAFLTHLFLDDIGEGGTEYLYPLYNGKVSVFSLMDMGFQGIGFFNYIVASFASVAIYSFVIMMTLFALDKLCFEFKYMPEK